MLKPAKNYETELGRKVADTAIDPYYKWWHLGYKEVNKMIEDTFWNKIQLVSVDTKGEVRSYFCADWKRPENFINSLNVVNFDKKDKINFALDFKSFMDYLMTTIKVSKIEWECVTANPIRSTYIKLVKKIGGRVVGIRKHHYLCDSRYYDLELYEWVNDYYMCEDCGRLTSNNNEAICAHCDGKLLYVNPFQNNAVIL